MVVTVASGSVGDEVPGGEPVERAELEDPLRAEGCRYARERRHLGGRSASRCDHHRVHLHTEVERFAPYLLNEIPQ